MLCDLCISLSDEGTQIVTAVKEPVNRVPPQQQFLVRAGGGARLLLLVTWFHGPGELIHFSGRRGASGCVVSRELLGGALVG